MKRLIIAITVLFIQNEFYSQSTLHHQSITAQGISKTLSNGLIINQTIGQQSVIGNSKTDSNIIFQDFYLTIDLFYLPAASYLVKVYASKINFYSKIIKRE